MKDNLDFGTGRLGSLLGRMAVPAVVSMVVNGLYYLVDAAFVGWGAGAPALAGLAVVFPIQMFMIAWGSMIGMGTASVISIHMGENRIEEAQKAVKASVISSLISGIVFTAAAFCFQQQMLESLGAGRANYEHAYNYAVWLQPGFVFVFLSMSGFNILRAQGLAKEAGAGMLLGTVVNLVLDPIFIFGFKMGTSGAALATVVARIVSTLYFILIIGKTGLPLQLCLKNSRLSRNTTGRIFGLGLGNFLGQVCFSIVAVIINNKLKKIGTDTDFAVYGILSRIHVFITMPLIGLAQGFQPIAGYNYGAGNTERVGKITRITAITAVLTGTLMFILPAAFPETVLGLFCRESTLIAAGIVPLRITLLMLPVIGLQILGFSFFQAVGNTKKTVIVSMSRQFFLLIPMLLVLPAVIGKSGIWIAFPIADMGAVLISIIMMAKCLNKELITA